MTTEDQRAINAAVYAMQEAGDRVGVEMTSADLEVLLRAALPYLTSVDDGAVATRQARDWKWGTHSKGSVNVIQRASEALARAAILNSGDSLQLYRRRRGGAWEKADQ